MDTSGLLTVFLTFSFVDVMLCMLLKEGIMGVPGSRRLTRDANTSTNSSIDIAGATNKIELKNENGKLCEKDKIFEFERYKNADESGICYTNVSLTGGTEPTGCYVCPRKKNPAHWTKCCGPDHTQHCCSGEEEEKDEEYEVDVVTAVSISVACAVSLGLCMMLYCCCCQRRPEIQSGIKLMWEKRPVSGRRRMANLSPANERSRTPSPYVERKRHSGASHTSARSPTKEKVTITVTDASDGAASPLIQDSTTPERLVQ